MRSETFRIPAAKSINWRLIIILAAVLLTLHFVLSNQGFEYQQNESPGEDVEVQPEGPEVPQDKANLYESSGLKDGLKHFFNLHHLDGKPKKLLDMLKFGAAPKNSTSTSKLRVFSSTSSSTSTTSEAVLSTTTGLPETTTAILATSTTETTDQAASTTVEHQGVATGLGGTTDEYVAICLSVKDQSKDLPEWLTHHYHHVGIKRFYIMDDGSDPPLSSYDIDYGIPKSAITFKYQDRATRAGAMQLIFYHQCIEYWGNNHTWMAFFDSDEFLETTSEESLEDVLKTFEKNETVGGIGVNWKMHSSGGLRKRPKSNRKAFTTCLNETYPGTHHDDHVKSIVKTQLFSHCGNPHKCEFTDDALTVGEHGDIIETIAWRTPVTRDRLTLHHYAVKSWEEYEEKMLRSNGMTDPKTMAFWDHVEGMPHLECKEMAKYDP